MGNEKQEIERLRAELKRYREMALQAAKLAELGKLMAVVAHEMSQPLLGIKAFAQILKRRFAGDEFIAPKITIIEEQAIHMESVLNLLREYSQVPRVEQRSVDPIRAVSFAMDLFAERARKLKVLIELDSQEPLEKVGGNRVHVQQILVNLLGNALDELEESKEIANKRISIQLRAVAAGVRIRVADTGRGIPESLIETIFEPFYTTKGTEKGTGLGLAICRDLAKAMGGEIRLMFPKEVEQAVGKDFSTGFEVFFPKARFEES